MREDQLLWLSETGEHLADGRLIGSIRDLSRRSAVPRTSLQRANETPERRVAAADRGAAGGQGRGGSRRA